MCWPRFVRYRRAGTGRDVLRQPVVGQRPRIGLLNQQVIAQVVDERQGRASLDADNDARIKQMILTRGGRPQDVANAALYLASKDAEFVTGVVMPVDGGASVVSGMPWVTPRPQIASEAVPDEPSWLTTR